MQSNGKQFGLAYLDADEAGAYLEAHQWPYLERDRFRSRDSIAGDSMCAALDRHSRTGRKRQQR